VTTLSFAEKTVLLTGAGGPAPAGMISVLRQWGYRTVAVDMLVHSPAFYLADAAYVVPAGNSPEFLPRLRQICEKERVDAVISVVDEELVAVLELEDIGVRVLQPQKAFVELCLDKHRCMNSLIDNDIPAPATWKVDSIPADASYPLFIKPITGRGSRGIGRIDSIDELPEFLKNSAYLPKQLMVQEFIDGPEYTISVIVWRDGEVQAVVPKEIISKVGVTRFAVTRHNEKIDYVCRKVQEKFQANGPFNVQLRLDKDGNPFIFEINPRFSTSITLTMAAGVDELGGLLSQALFGRASHQFSEWQEGVVMIRQTQDYFLSESEYRNHQVNT